MPGVVRDPPREVAELRRAQSLECAYLSNQGGGAIILLITTIVLILILKLMVTVNSIRYIMINIAIYNNSNINITSRDGVGVLVSTTFPSFQNHTFAHDLPYPSWVERKVHLSAPSTITTTLIIMIVI